MQATPDEWLTPNAAIAGLSYPHSHSIINGFGKSLFGLIHIPQWLALYRQKYRHIDWGPRAQRSSSIDIYRGQSALCNGQLSRCIAVYRFYVCDVSSARRQTNLL